MSIDNNEGSTTIVVELSTRVERLEHELANAVSKLARLERLVLPVNVDEALRMLAAATCGSVFSVAEVVDHAARVDPALRLLLERFGGSAKQIGKFLQRLAAAGPHGGIELVRVGREHNRALWQVRAAQ